MGADERHRIKVFMNFARIVPLCDKNASYNKKMHFTFLHIVMKINPVYNRFTKERKGDYNGICFIGSIYRN